MFTIFLMLIIVLLIFLLACLQILHYIEIKGLYSKIGIEIKNDVENKPVKKVKNHIKSRIKELEKMQGGD